MYNLSSDANTAAVKGVAGAMGSASAMNKAGCAASGGKVTAGKCVSTTGGCTAAVIGSLLDGGIPNDSSGAAYAIATVSAFANGVATCSVTGEGLMENFTLHSVP